MIVGAPTFADGTIKRIRWLNFISNWSLQTSIREIRIEKLVIQACAAWRHVNVRKERLRLKLSVRRLKGSIRANSLSFWIFLMFYWMFCSIYRRIYWISITDERSMIASNRYGPACHGSVKRCGAFSYAVSQRVSIHQKKDRSGALSLETRLHVASADFEWLWMSSKALKCFEQLLLSNDAKCPNCADAEELLKRVTEESYWRELLKRVAEESCWRVAEESWLGAVKVNCQLEHQVLETSNRSAKVTGEAFWSGY